MLTIHLLIEMSGNTFLNGKKKHNELLVKKKSVNTHAHTHTERVACMSRFLWELLKNVRCDFFLRVVQ